jgi:hypothetical protein
MPRHVSWTLATLVVALLSAAALAGGPLIVADDGSPVAWSTAAPVAYRTDGGNLSAAVNGAAAQTRIANMFAVWQNVASANIAYTRAGQVQAVAGFSDGDVSTLAEYDAVSGDCDDANQNPIIYDANGAIFTALNIDVLAVIGFAGPCVYDPDAGTILSGKAVMNGLFIDGDSNATNPDDLTDPEFDATFIHEFGHFSGLQHSQVNKDCFLNCGLPDSDDNVGLPTMFPFLMHSGQLTLAVDDIAWISKLYPASAAGTGFAATHGTITGTVFFSDGETHAQNVNVIARRVDNPATAGIDESRTTASANVSGHRFRIVNSNPINNVDCFVFCSDGTVNPADIGFYEIAVPPGNYMVEVESIDPAFTAGSSLDDSIHIPMPGTAPAPIGPITVTAGATSSGNDFTLVGTDPRFDQFEGPGP